MATLSLACAIAACGARTPLVGDGDATDAGHDATTALRRVGIVSATTTRPGLSGPEDVTAVFFDDALPPACADIGDRGTCAVVTCPKLAAPPPSINAGSIDVNVRGEIVRLAYGDQTPGWYPALNLSMVFTTGDTIRFTGGGGDGGVPAFNLTATAPNLVELDPPWFTKRMTIATSSDLSLTWGAAPTGDAVFHLSDDAGHLAVCFFDASARRGTISRADLSAFKALATGKVNALFYVAARDEIERQGWIVNASVVVWSGANWSQAGEVTLE